MLNKKSYDGMTSQSRFRQEFRWNLFATANYSVIGSSQTPDKRGYRKLDVLGRDMSGYATYQELDAASATTRCKSWLLVEVHGRPADTLSLEVKIYVDMVGDLDERNAFVHSVIPTVENHFPFDLA